MGGQKRRRERRNYLRAVLFDQQGKIVLVLPFKEDWGGALRFEREMDGYPWQAQYRAGSRWWPINRTVDR